MAQETERVKAALNGRVEALAKELYPNGRQNADHWCVGDITGEPGKSFKICLTGDKAGLWGDFAKSAKHSRNPIELWMQARNVDFKTALRDAAQWCGIPLQGVNGSEAAARKPNKQKSRKDFDWTSCVDAFTERHLERLADWRGLSGQFCSWLHRNGFVGLSKGCIAFPIHDSKGQTVSAHCRGKDGGWFVSPKGTSIQPLAIGKLATAAVVHVFESQWDAFAVCDRLRLHEKEDVTLLITRGAGNGALVGGIIPPATRIFAWKQNDELKDGKRAGDEWLRKVAAFAGVPVQAVTVPPEFKDANAWTLAGATADDLEAALDRAETLESSAPSLPAIIEAVCAFLRRYVVFQNAEQPIAVALWVAHSWALQAFDYTPYIHVASPEKQCGKTRLLDCLEVLTPKPWRAILPSEAVLFREIEKDAPTLLLDELDAVFTNSKDDRNEALRALLNAGFERKATIPRCVGQNQEVKHFAVFCAKALAGIGKLPDTVRDRSIPIQLARRSRDEKVERFRKREAWAATETLRDALLAWSGNAATLDILREARPNVPETLSDRQADICEPLLAIADLAGGNWPERARVALVALSSQANEDDSLGVKLLSDIREVFKSAEADRLSSQQILSALVEQETDSPWAAWWEQDLKSQNTRGPSQKLARRLKPHGIKPHSIRQDEGIVRGYDRKDFEGAWKRYCPPHPPENDETM